MKRDPNSPVQRIISLVSEATGISVDEINSRRRIYPVVEARNVAMVLAYEMLPGVPMRRLEWEFQKDHTTIKLACGRVTAKKPKINQELVEALRPVVRAMLDAMKETKAPTTSPGGLWVGAKDIVAILMREVALTGQSLTKIEHDAGLGYGFLSRYRCKHRDAESVQNPPMPIWAVCALCRYLGYTLNAVPLTAQK